MLNLLCCPACHGDLRSHAEEILCTRCFAAYPVVDGIPVFIQGSTLQSNEYRLREDVSREWLGRPVRQILHKLGKHHHLRVMEHHAHAFAGWVGDGCIVDLGAGWGWQWRSYRGPCPIVAVDFSLAACRLARLRFLRDNPFVHVVCADARSLPLQTVSGIWSVQALQHFPPEVLAVVLEECRRLARPGGLKAEIVNLHPVPFVRAIHTLLGRDYIVRGANRRFFLHRRTARELVAIFEPICDNIEVIYSELFFHPDLLLRWNWAYPVRLEKLIGSTRFARWLARQVHVRFQLLGQNEQSGRR